MHRNSKISTQEAAFPGVKVAKYSHTSESAPSTMAAPQGAPSKVAEVRLRHPLRLTAILVLALFIIIALVIIIIFLALQPKKLEFSIERGSITAQSFTAAGHLNATFNFLLRSRNPNRRVSFYYDQVDVKASFENTDVFVGKVGPFYQRRRNVTDLQVNMGASEEAVGGVVLQHLKMEWASGDVKLEVRIEADIRVKAGVFKVHRALEARCGPFDAPFSSSKGFNKVPCRLHISDG